MGQLGVMDEQQKRELISEVLTPNGYNLLVTPKEIGTEIRDLATLVSSGINRALHQKVEFS
jgi:spore protease